MKRFKKLEEERGLYLKDDIGNSESVYFICYINLI